MTRRRGLRGGQREFRTGVKAQCSVEACGLRMHLYRAELAVEARFSLLKLFWRSNKFDPLIGRPRRYLSTVALYRRPRRSLSSSIKSWS